MQKEVNIQQTQLKNRVGLFKLCDLKTRIAWTYALNIFDLIATTIWVTWCGIGAEANPIARWMYETNIVCVFKAVIVALGLWWIYKFVPRYQKLNWLTWVIFIVYAAIAAYHMFIATNLILILT